MDDIFNGNTKFVTLESVENFDKTALQERRIQRKVRNFYRVELIPKNVYEKIRPIESRDHGYVVSLKYINTTFPFDPFYL